MISFAISESTRCVRLHYILLGCANAVFVSLHGVDANRMLLLLVQEVQ